MSLFFGFLLLGGIWAIVVSVGWYGVASVPVVRRTYPQAKRSALSAFTGSVLFLSIVGCTTVLLREPLDGSTVSKDAAFSDTMLSTAILTENTSDHEGDSVMVSLTTDPPNAAVFVEDRLLGHSPVELQLAQGESATYLVIAPLERFRPFVGQVTALDNQNLFVWIDRRDPAEATSLVADGTASTGEFSVTGTSLSTTDTPAITGTVQSTSQKHFRYALLSFLLFDEADTVIGSSYAVLHEMVPGEERSFVTTPVAAGTYDFRLFEVAGLNP